MEDANDNNDDNEEGKISDDESAGNETSSLEDDDAFDESLDREARVEVLSVPGYKLHLTVHPHQDYHRDAKIVRVKLIKSSEEEDEGSMSGSERPDSDTANEIGFLEGFLLERPNEAFFKVADSISQELQELSVMFCNSVGKA